MGKASWKKDQQAQIPTPPDSRVPFLADWLVQPWIALVLLSFLAILIYSNTFFSSFQFDDAPYILENTQIRSFSSLLLSESRYVGLLSFAINYHFGQFNVFGYHLVSLAIHITNAFLVYILILALFKTPQMQSLSFDRNRSSWIALATSLLFVSHPIQTQAVTYITQRFASLAALFYLLAVVLYLKWRLAPSEVSSRSLLYFGALLSTVLAMKTKENTFTIPFMLLLVEALFFGFSIRKQWFSLIPFLLTLPIIPLSHLPERFFGEGTDKFAQETTAISRVDYLLTQFSVIMTYLRLLILPIHQNLDYDYPINRTLFEPTVFFSFLFLFALLGLAFYLSFYSQRLTRSNQLKLIGFGLLWFFLTLSIESSIIPIRELIFEYRLYLPSVGFWLACSMVVLGLLDRWWRTNTVVIGVMIAVFSIMSYQRNLIWKDAFTLWGDTVEKNPFKARAHYNMGMIYKDGRLEEAMREFQITLKLDPGSPARLNLGNVYRALGHRDKAIQEYKTILKLKPDSYEAHYNLGIVYKDLNWLQEAIQEFWNTLKLNPDYFQAYYSLGRAYQQMGRNQEAIYEFERALQIKPDYDPAREALKSLRR